MHWEKLSEWQRKRFPSRLDTLLIYRHTICIVPCMVLWVSTEHGMQTHNISIFGNLSNGNQNKNNNKNNSSSGKSTATTTNSNIHYTITNGIDVADTTTRSWEQQQQYTILAAMSVRSQTKCIFALIRLRRGDGSLRRRVCWFRYPLKRLNFREWQPTIFVFTLRWIGRSSPALRCGTMRWLLGNKCNKSPEMEITLNNKSQKSLSIFVCECLFLPVAARACVYVCVCAANVWYSPATSSILPFFGGCVAMWLRVGAWCTQILSRCAVCTSIASGASLLHSSIRNHCWFIHVCAAWQQQSMLNYISLGK